eukprot:CAMPEP_0198230152 /NCGR_PEP_ID=MMETSP1445-20131203/114509_1 /TAXON_ID=36898 /ORGANISM="Pyramimonas sp., Strain CCMP2087" /LENGTH=349 /DNA_ID=CAMNT_0043910667 /DNA_START=775 /DNA_END=1826 /DNA_ORIENTATION=-
MAGLANIPRFDMRVIADKLPRYSPANGPAPRQEYSAICAVAIVLAMNADPPSMHDACTNDPQTAAAGPRWLSQGYAVWMHRMHRFDASFDALFDASDASVLKHGGHRFDLGHVPEHARAGAGRGRDGEAYVFGTLQVISGRRFVSLQPEPGEVAAACGDLHVVVFVVVDADRLDIGGASSKLGLTLVLGVLGRGLAALFAGVYEQGMPRGIFSRHCSPTAVVWWQSNGFRSQRPLRTGRETVATVHNNGGGMSRRTLRTEVTLRSGLALRVLLVAQLWGAFFNQRHVAVFNGVVSPSSDQSCDFCPFVPMKLVALEKNSVLLYCPDACLQVGVQEVLPPPSTLLADLRR